MKSDHFLNEFPAEERQALDALAETASRLQPDERFVRKTGLQIMAARAEKKEKTMKRFSLIWQVLAGAAATVALVLGVTWLVRSFAPQPRTPALPLENPVSTTRPATTTPSENRQPTPTGTLEPGTYDWHGTQIKLAVEFPAAPADARLYTHSAFETATVAAAQAMAARFGIQGQVYLDNSGINGPKIYLVTDGKQRLTFISTGQFSYYADYTQAFVEAPVTLEAASAPIDAFLKAHGFDFAYRLEMAWGMGGGGWFYVLPLTLDGTPVRFDFGLAQRMEFQVSPEGQITSLNSYLLNLGSAESVGNFGLLSAEEAWQKVLGDAPFGVLQSSHSGSAERFIWYRRYPDGQPATIYGNVASFPAAEAGQPPLITLDGFPATGNTAGMEKLEYNAFAQASGQFFTENGIRKFRVEAWQVFEPSKMLYLEGSLRKDGKKVIFSSQGTDYSLPAAPADLPLPLEGVSVTGVADGATFNWQNILYFPNPSGGGGGGCGGSLAKLNLGGTPVPWPTFAPVVTPPVLPVGQRLEGVRGTLSVAIYQSADGSQHPDYYLYSPDVQFVALQGQGLEPLTNNQNRPLSVWGTVTGYNQNQMPVVTVERYEIPFPDLKFQILRGTQKLIKVDQQQVTLFTAENGQNYAQFTSTGNPDNNLLGVEGDLVQYEVLVVPGETFGGYPTLRVFSGSMAVNPKTGQPYPMEITADKPNLVPEPQPSEASAAPVLTIDSIELVYYTPDPRNAPNNPDATSPYLQPVWRFHGYYGDGSEAEFLIQALKPDFLLPEPAYTVQCG